MIVWELTLWTTRIRVESALLLKGKKLRPHKDLPPSQLPANAFLCGRAAEIADVGSKGEGLDPVQPQNLSQGSSDNTSWSSQLCTTHSNLVAPFNWSFCTQRRFSIKHCIHHLHVMSSSPVPFSQPSTHFPRAQDCEFYLSKVYSYSLFFIRGSSSFLYSLIIHSHRDPFPPAPRSGSTTQGIANHCCETLHNLCHNKCWPAALDLPFFPPFLQTCTALFIIQNFSLRLWSQPSWSPAQQPWAHFKGPKVWARDRKESVISGCSPEAYLNLSTASKSEL